MAEADEPNHHMTPETARAKPAAAVWDDIALLDQQLSSEEP